MLSRLRIILCLPDDKEHPPNAYALGGCFIFHQKNLRRKVGGSAAPGVAIAIDDGAAVGRLVGILGIIQLPESVRALVQHTAPVGAQHIQRLFLFTGRQQRVHIIVVLSNALPVERYPHVLLCAAEVLKTDMFGVV